MSKKMCGNKMSSIDKHSSKTIPNPSWENVRTLYKKLSDEFGLLTDSFKIELSQETKTNLDHLIIVIDDVDQCIDELPKKSTRDAITSSLIAYLENNEEKWFHEKASTIMLNQIEILKIIILKEDIQREFIEAAKEIFNLTELKRHTEKVDELIKFIKLEGEATARLPLSILKIDPQEKFGIFFSRLCMIMGIVDLVFDANQDYKKGYIQIKPSIKLYFKLIKITISEGLKLIFSFPNKFKFLIYCYKFTIALIKE